jgi:hypothetical protein
VAQHSETADNYLADVFLAPSNQSECQVRGRAQRFSERLAKTYPSRTASLLKQAACCIQSTELTHATLILGVLIWSKCYDA